MNTEIYQYMRKLHTFIEHQDKKLRGLEKSVLKLQEEIARLKDRPPIQVGNIEYKFDQLKVETLEGTLNIGLNPSDLEGISDFSVDNKHIKTPVSPKDLFNRGIEIETELREYLEANLPDIYQNTQKRINITVDDSYYTFIKDDILKQLPNRIADHLNGVSTEERGDSEKVKQGIVTKLKGEIEHGVFLFLNQLHEQKKGETE